MACFNTKPQQVRKTMSSALPAVINSEPALDDLLSEPSAAVIDFIRSVHSPLVILGAGGKMGPTLAVLARRAAEVARHPLDVIAVSRFSDAAARRWLEDRSVRTLSLDLLEPSSYAQLPDSGNVISLVGLKFGTSINPAATWAVNTLVSAQIAERYAQARIVALSTGNVYPLVPVSRGGSVETDPLTPLGEYANAAVARERIYEFVTAKNDTPLALIRLNYAVELRYGVLVDIARKVFVGTPVDVTMGHLNCIWQGDANAMILRALGLAETPAIALNLTGAQVLSVRQLALGFGMLLRRTVTIIGKESETALLSNAGQACARLGSPPTAVDTVMKWIAHWLTIGGRLLGKPTHFEERAGRY